MRKIRLLLKFMSGSRVMYLSSVIAVGLASMFSLIRPIIIRFTIDSVIGKEEPNVPSWILTAYNSAGGKQYILKNIWLISILLVIVTLLSGLFLYLKGRFSNTASESAAKNMRDTLYAHIQDYPYRKLIQTETGDLIQRCTSDVETIRKFLAMQFVEMGRAVFMVLIAGIVMFSIHPQLALISMAVIPVIFIFSYIFFKQIQKAFRKSDESEGRLTTVLQENLTGVRVVKAFARQHHEIDKFETRNTEYRKLTEKLISLLALYWGVSDALSLSQLGIVLIIGGYSAAMGTISIGTFVMFFTFVGRLLWPVRQMGRILTEMGKASVSLERISEVLDEKTEDYTQVSGGNIKAGRVEFENVGFSYEDSPILSEITFTAEPGETIAVLGPTGSGKSTLVHLLPRLFDPDQGTIRIDGTDITTMNKKDLRGKVGIVLQEPFLFQKTIKENISLGINRDNEVVDKEIEDTARTASIHDVILSFEKGYETQVGEGGVTLSGGQKQRTAIARTLLRKPAVLIFDDSLSAVDTETDAAIRRALKQRNHKPTTFIISHRLSTLAEADRILVLEKGRIVQLGTHQELLNEDGLYRRIWAIQNSLEQELEQELTSIKEV
ncbi:MAG: ABC transporter ATP-binding protein [Spirochaetia bacterium]